MWSIAPLSIIHSLGNKAGGMTRLEEKTECSKLVDECKQRGMELIESRHLGLSKMELIESRHSGLSKMSLLGVGVGEIPAV